MGKITEPKRVLITGGFGYLGGRLTQYLTEYGYKVIIGTRKNHNNLEWPRSTEVVQLYWDDEEALVNACKGINVIIHTAGMNAKDCESDPVAALAFNGLATARLVCASKKAGVTKFIYTSTAHVYCSPLVGKITDRSCPSNHHPYATSHLAGENAVLFGSKNQSNFTGVVLRLSNVVGVPASDNANCWMLFVNDICREASKSNSITIRNNPEELRDFVSMATVCEVCHCLISDEDSNLTYTYNIGSGESLSLLQIANMVKAQYKNLHNISLNLILPKINEKLKTNFKYIPSKLPFEIGNEVDVSLSSEIDKLIKYCDLKI